MIYRIEILSSDMGSEGFVFVPSKAEASRVRSEYVAQGYDEGDIRVDSFTVPRTKAEVLALLGRVASHPDNG